MNRFIIILISTFSNVVTTLLLIYVVLSWVVPGHNKYKSMLDNLMNTFLDPIRKILPNTGMLDLSPIILMLLLQFIDTVSRQIFK